jgi:TolB-like protein/Tfp pilus assembly protein PilF
MFVHRRILMSENDGSSEPQGEAPSTEAALDPDTVRDVFVSYASQDVVVANAVVVALERAQISCWIAPRDVVPGALYADGIIRAITDSKVFVLVLSQSAIASNHVSKEVERASSKRRPIVALRTDAAPLTPALEYFLSESQWIDVDAARPEKAVTQAVNAVRRHMAGEHAIDPRADSNIPHMPKSLGNGGRVGMQLPGRRSIAVIALVGVLVLAGAYFMVDRFGGLTHKAQSLAASVPVAPAAVPATPVISEKSVAVLPFIDMSEKKDQEYFSDGLSEELIDMLTKVSDLRVPARTSSFYFKGKSEDIPTIAKRLSVAHVLEGSVRKSGNHMRITVQLVRADTGYHLWSQTYDRKVDDIFKVQDEIAGAVVKALKISLMGGTLPESAGTQNVEAYNLYLQSRAIHLRAKSRSDFEKEVEYLRKAIDADPRFANAWASLATALSVQAQYNYVPARQAVEESRRAANRALELNPRLPDAHTALARIYMSNDLDIRTVEAQVQLALALAPNNSYALATAANLASSKGEFDKAIDLAQRSIDSDPVNPVRYRDLASAFYSAGKYPESMAAIAKHDDLQPGANDSIGYAGFIMLATGDPAGALAKMDSDPDLASCGCRVLALDALGRKSEADLALAKLEQDHAHDGTYDIALVYASRGEVDQAFKWLDRAYRQHEPDLSAIKVDPLLKNVQADPRFKQLLIKLGLQD